jgi:hypothetical protein
MAFKLIAMWYKTKISLWTYLKKKNAYIWLNILLHHGKSKPNQHRT